MRLSQRSAEALETPKHIVLYTYHDGKDVFTPSLVEQEALCNEYILSQKLNIAKEYSDLCDLSIKTEDRPGFKQLMNDLDTENNSMIIVNHLQVFGVTLSSSLIVTKLLEKKRKIFIVEEKRDLLSTGEMNLFSIMSAIQYTYSWTDKVYLVFSNKTGEEIDYKGSFTSVAGLIILLVGNCANDNRLQIRPLRSMAESWNYHSDSTIGNEIQKCVDTFHGYISK
jgi:hypothetical protein